jgi:hypothetical protein
MRRRRHVEPPPKWDYPEPGRIQLEMDIEEYERMRRMLPDDFEWKELVRLREGRKRAQPAHPQVTAPVPNRREG